MNTNKTSLQDLNLQVGEKAKCKAGYPGGQTVTVVCVRAFGSFERWGEKWTNMLDNYTDYVKPVGNGSILTSHLISNNWIKI